MLWPLAKRIYIGQAVKRLTYSATDILGGGTCRAIEICPQYATGGLLMIVTEGASAMTEASGLPGDEGRIDRAADAIRGMTKEMVQELPARRVRLPEKLRQIELAACPPS
jgi:hypothetical protein